MKVSVKVTTKTLIFSGVAYFFMPVSVIVTARPLIFRGVAGSPMTVGLKVPATVIGRGAARSLMTVRAKGTRRPLHHQGSDETPFR